MSRYEPRTPRTIAIIAAAFMTLATLAVCVAGPAGMESSSDEVTIASTVAAPDKPAAEAGALTTSIDVVAVRTTRRVPVVNTRAQLRSLVAG